MNSDDLKARTKEFAKRIIRLCRTLPNTREGWRIGDQIFRSGTSVGSNYRAACRGRSKAEFVAKLGTVLEEADETLFWLELMCETEMVKASNLEPLMRENRELLAIFVASMNTAKGR
jgi:four helix bundle protein